ncbi:uncharacterized protein EHS24_003474 [Apiotrichum porosum]|uniref:Uncharacterized protein n=1 Tax=Apiotrichum porosum TaxID=105984 RepID=A0A427XFF6_9TREE|nr:uncharacterized protein EHS24_003474 [Apiotrichum porosum]RSH77497.1 hypothetical protein EHS24_003474 [Apiotrichum porosum]
MFRSGSPCPGYVGTLNVRSSYTVPVPASASPMCGFMPRPGFCSGPRSGVLVGGVFHRDPSCRYAQYGCAIPVALWGERDACRGECPLCDMSM